MGLLAVNFVAVNYDPDANGNVSLTSLLNTAFANQEDPSCVPPCPSGYTCVAGSCIQQQQRYEQICTAKVFCFSPFGWHDVPGHEKICRAVTGGSTNCLGEACTPDYDPCNF